MLQYLTVNNLNMTFFDVDADGHLSAAEVREAIRHHRNVSAGDVEPQVPSDEVLEQYAADSCFLPTQAGERQVSRRDDTTVAGDENGGLLPDISAPVLDAYGFQA